MKVLFLTISLILTQAVVMAHEVIGYLPEYRVSDQTLASMKHCTDVVYFGNTLAADGSITMSPVASKHLKTIKSRLQGTDTRLILCLGGWKKDEHFPAVTSSEQSRVTFAETLAKFAKKYDIDGVDLDWEYPKNAQQWHDLGKLIAAGKKAMGARPFIWSVAVHPRHLIPNEVVKQLDRIHLMTYDAGKKHCDTTVAQTAIQEWKKRGVPANKLCIGVAFYGRKMENRNEVKTYAELFQIYGKAVQQSQTAGGFFYDNPRSCRIKKEMVTSHQLRGLIVWEIGQDARGEAALLPLLK
ncbi:glycoside hydrolase family 18 protein [Oceaniferula spumae]